MSLATPQWCSALQAAFHAELRFGVRLFREPDAGNPPVRFDEREEETELSQTGLRRRGESPANRPREATVTAPLLDSTHLPISDECFRCEPNRKELKCERERLIASGDFRSACHPIGVSNLFALSGK